MEKKKKSKRLGKGLIGLIALLVVIAAVTVVAAVKGPSFSKSANGSDRELRKQLADDSVTEIELTEDIDVSAPLEVNGSKKIIGSGKLVAADDYKAIERMGLLTLTNGADVIIGGSVTVDAKNVDCAVYVTDGAALTLENDVVLLNASLANVYVLGELKQSGGNVEAGYDNVYIANGGSFLWEKGGNRSSVNHGIHVEEGAKVQTTSDKAEMKEAGSHGIYLMGKAEIDDILLIKSHGNQIDIMPTGELTMKGGSIAYGSASGVSNQGIMVMNGGSIYNHEYCGVVNSKQFDMKGGSVLNNKDKGIVNKNGGKLLIVDAGANVGSNASGIINEENAYCELANANISGNKTNNVINLGEIYIHDISLRNSGSNSLNTQHGGHTELKDVEIDGTTKNHGIYCAFGGVIEMTNVTVKNTASRGIQNYDGTIKGSNITFENIGNCAIVSLAHARRGGGVIELDKVTTKDVTAHNLMMDGKGAGTVIIKDSTFGASGSNNVAVKAGEATLTNVKIEGNIKGLGQSTHGVYATGGKLYMKDCSIRGTVKSAIRNNGGQVEAENLSVANITEHNIFASKGATVLKNSTLAASDYHHIYCKGGTVKVQNSVLKEGVVSDLSVTAEGVVTVDHSTLGATSSNSVTITGGRTTINNTKILGQIAGCADSVHGVYVKDGGKIALNNSFIGNTSGSAVRNNGGHVEAVNLSTENITVHNIFASSGQTIVKNSTLASSDYHHIYARDTASVTVDHCTLQKGAVSCVSITGGANVSIAHSTLEATSSNNVRISDGTVTVRNTNILGTSKKDCHGIYISAGNATVQNVTIRDTMGSGIRNNGGALKADGLTTENCGLYSVHSSDNGNTTIKNGTIGVCTAQNSIYVSGGTVTLEKTSVHGTTKASTHGVYAIGGKVYVNQSLIRDTAGAAFRNNGGYIESNGTVTENVGTYNIHSTKGETIVKAGSLCATTTQNNIYVDGGIVRLSDTSVLGTTKSGCHGIYAVKGDAYIQNSHICNTTGAAIRNNTAGNVTVTGLTVNNIGTYNVHHSSTGTTTIKESKLAAPRTNHIYSTTNGKVLVDNCVLEKSVDNSIRVTGGAVAVEGTKILGTTKASTHGVYATGGTVHVNHSYVSSVAGSAIRNDGGEVVVAQLDTENITDYNVFASKGTTTIQNCVFGLTNTNQSVRINKSNKEGKLVLKDLVKIPQITTNVSGTYVLIDGVLKEGSAVTLNPAGEVGMIAVQSTTEKDMTANLKYLTLSESFLAESMKLELNGSNTAQAIIGLDTAAEKVARVGETIYDSLQDAVNSAANSADKTITVEILKNIYLSSKVNVPEGCNVTIIDNGVSHRISRYGTWKEDAAMFALGTDSVLTFASTNTDNIMLTLDGNKESTIVTTNTGFVVVPEKATVNVNAGIQISNHEVQMENGGIIRVEGGTLNLSGGVLTDNAVVDVSVSSGKVNLFGKDVVKLYKGKEGSVNIGTAFDGASKVTFLCEGEVKKGDVLASCDSEDAAKAAAGCFTLEGENLRGCILESSGKNLVLNVGIARIGTILYENLQDAVAAVEAMENKTAVIEMMSNISLTETITIPENCHITLKDDGVAARTITRSKNWSKAENDAMFALKEGSQLSFASTSKNDNKIMLTVDGNKANVTATKTSRMVQIPAKATVNIGAGVKISNHKIEGGKKETHGAAISVDGGTFNMTGGIVDGNEVVGTDNAGGGINVAAKGSIVNITGGTFSNNVSEKSNGGALNIWADSTVVVKNATFSKNKAGNHGGAIRMQKDSLNVTLTVDHCTFESNEAAYGAAVGHAAIKGGSVTVSNCTFRNNKASKGGGAINLPDSGNSIYLGDGNTFSGNTGGTGTDLRVVYGTVYITGRNSFEANLYNANKTTVTILEGFDAASRIILNCQTKGAAKYVMVNCPSEDSADEIIDCFTLKGTNLKDFALDVSGTKLILKKQ